jgi:electron transport complex protein RnfE
MARKEQTMKSIFTNGILKQNPTFVQFLGMCPTLAVTKTVSSALGMGAGVIFVLVLSNLVISLIRNYVPKEVRIPMFIVVIASLVTILEMFMELYVNDLYVTLGTFLSLIVVNCLILGRAEAFASKNGPLKSMMDGLGMAIGFTLGITLIAFFRELLGAGSITIWGDLSLQILPEAYQISILVKSAGAFLVFGILVSQINKIKMRNELKEVA